MKPETSSATLKKENCIGINFGNPHFIKNILQNFIRKYDVIIFDFKK